jgi:hypothetical protein
MARAGNGREGGALKEDQLDVGLEVGDRRNQPRPGVGDSHYGARDDRANGALETPSNQGLGEQLI